MSRSQRPDTTTRTQFGDEEAQIRVWRSDPDFAARIEIEGTETWEFGVDAEGIAQLLTTTEATELVADPEIPDWVEDTLVGFGVIEILPEEGY